MGLELSGILGQGSPNYQCHMPSILFSNIRPFLVCKSFFLYRYNIGFLISPFEKNYKEP